jgi:DnaD/phage-associated family protein
VITEKETCKGGGILMARYRSLETTFWQDNFIVRLPLEEKAFYSYILTNTRTCQCGIYSFSLVFSAVELGCSEEKIRELISKFTDYGKILYDESTEEIMIVNWYKYNLSTSIKTLICVNKELKAIKNKAFIKKFYNLCKNTEYDLGIIFEGIEVGEQVKPALKSEEAEIKKATISEVVRHFSSNIHLASPIELEDLKSWCEKLSSDIVIMAIDEAVRNNARNMKYINGILINWVSENLNTAEDVRTYIKDRQAKTAKGRKPKEEIQNSGAYKIVGEVS